MIPRWERVQTRKGWHVRFRAGNGEPVVHGENLADKASCNTAIVAVAAAHSPTGEARIIPARSISNDANDVVALYPADVMRAAVVKVPVVDVDERKPRWRRRG